MNSKVKNCIKSVKGFTYSFPVPVGTRPDRAVI